MRKGKNWLLVVLLIALLGCGIYLLTFSWLLPKTVAFALPGKWSMVPLRQPKATVHGYLGEPTHSLPGIEEWIRKGGPNKQFSLLVYYGVDSTAVSYSIHLNFKSWLVNRSYLMDSASIR